VFGLERGYCLMIGARTRQWSGWTRSSPRSPGFGSAEPTPGRTRTTGTAPDGYLHCGPNGRAFVKMVHNGIEYGMMAAIGRGAVHHQARHIGKADVSSADAETTPLRGPEFYQYDIDVAEVASMAARLVVGRGWST